MDLDDFDAPVQAPSKAKKFAPRGSKLKPQTEPKPEPQSSLPQPKLEPKNDVEEEIDIKPKIDVVPNAEPSVTNGLLKLEIDSDAGAATDGDGDMIVREIDVFFTPSSDSKTQLYVMQYPLRPSWRPYELEERCHEVRVKPATSEVEMDLSIDDSSNWDSEVADRLNITKQTLGCSWKPSPASGYAIGILMGDKLHVSPLHAVVQLRPSQKWNSATCNAESVVKIEGSVPQKKQVQKNQTESASDEKSGLDERWMPLKYHDSKSDLSSRYLQQIVAEESSSIDFTMNSSDYMSSLCPGSSHENKSKGPSKSLLLSLPIEERVKKLLLEGPPVQRFNALKFYNPDCSNEDLLAYLQKYGILVQGLWAPKTSLLFQNLNPSESTKRPARDYVLSVLRKNLVINSSHLNVPIKLKDNVHGFLEMYAVERKYCRDWKFREQPDTSFIKLYPDIVKKQEEVWNIIEGNLVERLSRPQKGVPSAKNAPEKPNLGHSPAKLVNSSNENAGKTVNTLISRTIADETRESLRRVLPKVFQNHKVCSFQSICQGLEDLAITHSNMSKADAEITVIAASVAKAPHAALHEVISEVATNVHGSYVLKSSPEHPEHNPLRKVVIDLLLARGPNAKLKKADVFEAARLTLKRNVTTAEYTKVMTDICEYRGAAWVLKSGDAKLLNDSNN